MNAPSSAPIISNEDTTKKRIKLLAQVGHALFEINNEQQEDNVYYLALSSLDEFRKEIEKLELDLDSLEGIKKLSDYLETKLKKRISQRQNT